jgi:hypothetical protein
LKHGRMYQASFIVQAVCSTVHIVSTAELATAPTE